MIIRMGILAIYIYIYKYIYIYIYMYMSYPDILLFIFLRLFIFKCNKSISSSRSTNNSPGSERPSHPVIGYGGQPDLGIGAGVGLFLCFIAFQSSEGVDF